MPQAILIVMQDVLFSQTLRHKLSRFGVKVFITETPVQALEILGTRKMDVVLLDVRGNNLPAVQFLKEWSTLIPGEAADALKRAAAVYEEEAKLVEGIDWATPEGRAKGITVLEAAGIKVAVQQSGTVSEAAAKVVSGQAEFADKPNVEGHW